MSIFQNKILWYLYYPSYTSLINTPLTSLLLHSHAPLKLNLELKCRHTKANVQRHWQVLDSFSACQTDLFGVLRFAFQLPSRCVLQGLRWRLAGWSMCQQTNVPLRRCWYCNDPASYVLCSQHKTRTFHAWVGVVSSGEGWLAGGRPDCCHHAGVTRSWRAVGRSEA